jgi:hypothetical protein
MFPNLPGSGNCLVDRLDRELNHDEEYCSDCKSSPCQCDEKYEQSREEE